MTLGAVNKVFLDELKKKKKTAKMGHHIYLVAVDIPALRSNSVYVGTTDIHSSFPYDGPQDL